MARLAESNVNSHNNKGKAERDENKGINTALRCRRQIEKAKKERDQERDGKMRWPRCSVRATDRHKEAEPGRTARQEQAREKRTRSVPERWADGRRENARYGETKRQREKRERDEQRGGQKGTPRTKQRERKRQSETEERRNRAMQAETEAATETEPETATKTETVPEIEPETERDTETETET